MPKAAVQPETRFGTIASALLGAGGTPAATPEKLQQQIAGARATNTEVNGALAAYLSQHTALTLAKATSLVADNTKPDASDAATAQAVSGAASAALSASGEVDLSDPVMLSPWVRVSAGAVMVLVAVLATVFLDRIATKQTVATAAVIGIAVVGILAVIAVLVLVMGYKSVTIKGSTGGSGSS